MSRIVELITNLNNWYTGVSKILTPKSTNPVRFGVISAAGINPTALFDPVRTHPDAIVVAVAARSLTKAQDHAKKYKIPNAYGSYDELLSQTNIDAVYIPLPNGLHCEWAIKAMRAGKHVLIEKPIAANADEVRQIRECAEETGKIALEAYHWQFHPAAHVVKSLVDSGRYGNLLSTYVSMPLPAGFLTKDDIRLKYDKLAGGACMDLAYVFSATRYFVGASDYEVSDAKARIHSRDKKVDEAMTANLIFHMGNGKPDVTSTVMADLVEARVLGIIPPIWHPQYVKLELEKATITYTGFPLAHLSHKIAVQSKETGLTFTQKHYSFGPQWGPRSEPWWSTYRYQMEAFVSKIKGEEPKHWIDLDESMATMETIDRVYKKAGMVKRGL